MTDQSMSFQNNLSVSIPGQQNGQYPRILGASCLSRSLVSLTVNSTSGRNSSVTSVDQPVDWCIADLDADTEHNIWLVLSLFLLAVLVFLLAFVACLITWLTMIDKVLACIKLVSLPSESSLCSATTAPDPDGSDHGSDDHNHPDSEDEDAALTELNRIKQDELDYAYIIQQYA